MDVEDLFGKIDAKNFDFPDESPQRPIDVCLCPSTGGFEAISLERSTRSFDYH